MAVRLDLSDKQADALLVLLVDNSENPILRDSVIPRLAMRIAARKTFITEREKIRNAAER